MSCPSPPPIENIISLKTPIIYANIHLPPHPLLYCYPWDESLMSHGNIYKVLIKTLLFRSINGYTTNSRLSHKTPLSLSVSKIKHLKKKDIYTLVFISGQLLQNVKNRSPCVCYLLIFWAILEKRISKRVSWWVISLYFFKKYFVVNWHKFWLRRKRTYFLW